MLLCISRHCPMLIMSLNVEIWIAQSHLGILTFVHYTRRCTHCLHPESCPGQLVLKYLLLVFDEKEVLVQ